MKNTKPASNEQLFDCNENKRKKGGLFYENSLTKAGSDQIIFFFNFIFFQKLLVVIV